MSHSHDVDVGIGDGKLFDKAFEDSLSAREA